MMASLDPRRPEDKHQRAGRLNFVVQPSESLHRGMTLWLLAHAPEPAAQQAAEDLADLPIPGLVPVVRPLAVAWEHVGVYSVVVVFLRREDDDVPAATRREELQQGSLLRLGYNQSRRPELQAALRGEVEYHVTGTVQVVGLRYDLTGGAWRAALGPCYLHPADDPEQDLIDPLAPFAGRLGLAKPQPSGKEVFAQVEDQIAVLAKWGVQPERGADVVLAFQRAIDDVERQVRSTVHRPEHGKQLNALELVLADYYESLLSHYRSEASRKAMQENIANMAKKTVIPRLVRDVPGLHRPKHFRVTDLLRLHIAAKTLSGL